MAERLKIEKDSLVKDAVVSIQDSYSVRNVPLIHNSVRKLLIKKGYSIKESKYCKEKTLYCGMGGMVGMLRPSISNKALEMATAAMPANEVISYCGGCHSMFLRTEKSHLSFRSYI
ncbi:hypothetical protein AZF37_01150 [endosymbiont 'TC1' of Trimyema compressum]|uniref:hypothetical protein n=1 Tax=endosymbiont 'TC1' of Trimyema compressum TaxID=243899 RepID=UPI0007F1596A|nr:hypothetical protein [endosymbiont 'TC1' of Trimyema compressum]AMP19973.1 hypothetical protein AZF37_01150 [endosymbiont 'TC1' of Trimyema compressum]